MPFEPTDAWIAEVRTRVPELPLQRKQRLMQAFGLPAGDAQVLTDNLELGRYFESAAAGYKNPKAIANWVINNLAARLSEAGATPASIPLTPAGLRELVELVDSGKISGKIAQEVFSEIYQSGASAASVVETRGLSQVSDSGAIEALADQVIASNPGPASDFRAGKGAALNFLKGQLMKLSKGKANPALAGEILERKLKA
jgi:aspartyl-tRNA(Asn)/glutamyl-tRNA(Gln) amidotransferase subunit B